MRAREGRVHTDCILPALRAMDERGGIAVFHMNRPPCKHCKTRHEGCHSRCVDYLDWKRRREEIRQKQYEENAADGVIIKAIKRAAYDKRRH